MTTFVLWFLTILLGAVGGAVLIPVFVYVVFKMAKLGLLSAQDAYDRAKERERRGF